MNCTLSHGDHILLEGNMAPSNAFLPQSVYSLEDDRKSLEDSGKPNAPRVLIAPHRYIQGEGVLDYLGRYLSVISAQRPVVLITKGGQKRFGQRLQQSMVDLRLAVEIFRGECSIEEVERVVSAQRGSNPPVDCIIAVGGGKCLDAGKCIRCGACRDVCQSDAIDVT